MSVREDGVVLIEMGKTMKLVGLGLILGVYVGVW